MADFIDFIITATKDDPQLGEDFLNVLETVASENELSDWFKKNDYTLEPDEVSRIFKNKDAIVKMELSRNDVKQY